MINSTKIIYKIEGIISALLGIIIIFNAETNILGNVIGLNEFNYNSNILWGMFFLISGLALFFLAELKR